MARVNVVMSTFTYTHGLACTCMNTRLGVGVHEARGEGTAGAELFHPGEDAWGVHRSGSSLVTPEEVTMAGL